MAGPATYMLLLSLLTVQAVVGHRDDTLLSELEDWLPKRRAIGKL